MEGSVIEAARGKVKNPRWNVYDSAVMVLRQMFDQFGLTPLARMRLKAPEKPPEAGDPLDFLN
jgi:P27 family predicted phage terminase small subunit